MIAFTIRRLAATVMVMFGLSIIVFLIFFATPGIDPARQLAGKDPNPATLAAIRHDFGLDRPLPAQYLLLMKHLLVDRDLQSYTNRGVKVIPEIASAAPVTLSLVLGAAVVWVIVSVALGVAAAVLRGSFWDKALMALALIGISMPVFWLGEVANLFTQDRWHGIFLFSWVPPLGYTPLAQDPVLWLRHLVIPWLVLATLYIGLYARILRAAVIDAETQDFVRTARSKGISERRVLIRHVLRTSMIGFVSVFGLDFGALVGGGALLVEVVFGLPGIGQLTYQSLQGLDLPVIMATVLYGGFFIVIVNALVDLLYARLDPRIREA
jgi:peptide/nickel transport system permease protein